MTWVMVFVVFLDLLGASLALGNAVCLVLAMFRTLRFCGFW